MGFEPGAHRCCCATWTDDSADLQNCCGNDEPKTTAQRLDEISPVPVPLRTDEETTQ